MKILKKAVISAMTSAKGGWINRANGRIYIQASAKSEEEVRAVHILPDGSVETVINPVNEEYIAIPCIDEACLMHSFMVQKMEEYKGIFLRYSLLNYEDSKYAWHGSLFQNEHVTLLRGEFWNSFMQMLEENPGISDLFDLYCNAQYNEIAFQWCKENGILE